MNLITIKPTTYEKLQANPELKFVKLSEIASDNKYSLVDGPFGSSLKTSDFVNDGIPVLQGKNITGNKFIFSNIRFISSEKSEQLKRSKVVLGDILIIKIGSIGYAAEINDLGKYPHAIIPANLVKITINKNKVDKKFLIYWLQSDSVKKYFENIASKTAQPALSLKKIKDLPVFLPSLIKQKYIATQLDKANSVLNLYKLSIDKLDELARSIFCEIDKSANLKFKLDEISKIVSGATPKSNKKEYWNGKICWATPAELNKLDNIYINTTLRKITDAGLKNCSASLLPINSILFSSRAPIGHLAINTVPMTTNQGFKSFITNKNIVEPVYLYYWLNYNREFLQGMGVGATFKELSKNLISSIKINLPSLDKQHVFVKKINSLHKIKIDKKKILLKHLKFIASLQQESFGIN